MFVDEARCAVIFALYKRRHLRRLELGEGVIISIDKIRLNCALGNR